MSRWINQEICKCLSPSCLSPLIFLLIGDRGRIGDRRKCENVRIFYRFFYLFFIKLFHEFSRFLLFLALKSHLGAAPLRGLGVAPGRFFAFSLLNSTKKISKSPISKKKHFFPNILFFRKIPFVQFMWFKYELLTPRSKILEHFAVAVVFRYREQ